MPQLRALGTGRVDGDPRDVGLGRGTRFLLPTDRADLSVRWHEDGDLFVLSLWHSDVCVGTAPLRPTDAAELASFLVAHLGGRGPSGTRRST